MPMKTDNDFNFISRIDYGVKKGANNARLEHKKAGRSIFVLENGKIVEIPPEKIEEDDNLPPSPI